MKRRILQKHYEKKEGNNMGGPGSGRRPGKTKTMYGSIRMGTSPSGKSYVKNIYKKTKSKHTTTSTLKLVSRKTGRAYPSGTDRDGKTRPEKIVFKHPTYVGRKSGRKA